MVGEKNLVKCGLLLFFGGQYFLDVYNVILCVESCSRI